LDGKQKLVKTIGIFKPIRNSRNKCQEYVLTSIEKPKVLTVSLIQIAILLLIILGLFFVTEIIWKSFLLGGTIAIIPHAYFSVYAFRYLGASSTQKITQSFYRGEAGKFILTLVGFSVTFLWFENLNVRDVFISYVLMVLLQLYLTARVIKQY
jgi:ATP synthase protein I